MPVTQDRAHGFLAAVALLGADDRRATYGAGRATLCAGPDDLARYDQVFEACFDARDGLPRARPREPRAPRPRTCCPTPRARRRAGETEDEDVVRADGQRRRGAAAPRRRLARRRRRSAGWPAMFATLPPRPPVRRTARHQRWHRGEVDASRTLRDSLRRLGEPGDIAWRRRGIRPRRVVLLVDVCGSMSAYADALLRLAHRLTRSARARAAPSRPSPSAPG